MASMRQSEHQVLGAPVVGGRSTLVPKSFTCVAIICLVAQAPREHARNADTIVSEQA